MRIDLTDAELDFYATNGFLVLPDFLDTDEIDELEAAVVEVLSEGWPGIDPFEAGAVSASSNLAHHMNPFQRNPRIRKFSTDPRLAELTFRLEGVESIRLYQDMIAIKPAWGGPTGFHMDVPRISFTSDHAVSYWFPLVDATLSNACLYYLPGAHLQKRSDCRGVYRMDELATVDPAWATIEPLPAPVARGGVVLHEGYAPHGTNANITPHPRPAFVVTHMPENATFDGTPNLVQPDEMDVGAPLDDDARFPPVRKQ